MAVFLLSFQRKELRVYCHKTRFAESSDKINHVVNLGDSCSESN